MDIQTIIDNVKLEDDNTDSYTFYNQIISKLNSNDFECLMTNLYVLSILLLREEEYLNIFDKLMHLVFKAIRKLLREGSMLKTEFSKVINYFDLVKMYKKSNKILLSDLAIMIESENVDGIDVLLEKYQEVVEFREEFNFYKAFLLESGYGNNHFDSYLDSCRKRYLKVKRLEIK